MSELFNALRNTGLPVGLITNGASDIQRTKLDALGIEDWFNVIVVSGEVGKAKPDASIFEVALNELGLEPHDVWHIGDNLEADVAGAKAAGLTAVWLNRSGRLRRESDTEPHIEIRTLSQLLKEFPILASGTGPESLERATKKEEENRR